MSHTADFADAIKTQRTQQVHRRIARVERDIAAAKARGASRFYSSAESRLSDARACLARGDDEGAERASFDADAYINGMR